MSGIAIVIVAAGASSRMKKAKQLLPLGETTLLGNAVKQAKKATVDEVLVVLGANAAKIKSEIREFKVSIIENKNWEEGIGSSVVCGIKHLVEKGNFGAVLLMLGDQPLIDTSYLDQMITEFRKDPAKIIATKYPGSNGVPALFPKEYFQELRSLKGDSGAKYLLNSDSSSITVLNAGYKILDIDTPEEYRDFLKSL